VLHALTFSNAAAGPAPDFGLTRTASVPVSGSRTHLSGRRRLDSHRGCTDLNGSQARHAPRQSDVRTGWMAFVAYWIAAPARAKRSVRHGYGLVAVMRHVAIATGVFMLLTMRHRFPWLPALCSAKCGLCIDGGCSLRGRPRHCRVGGNAHWCELGTTDNAAGGTRAVSSGPYAYVRHPVYAGSCS
jgi:hypothetical protein